MNDRPTLLLSSWVAPMDGPCIRDGAIAFQQDGILAVGDARKIRGAFPAAEMIDLGDRLIMPGLVNAHVHLELSDLLRIAFPAGGFVAWLLDVISRRPFSSASDAVARGVGQCLKFGVTAVGDITAQCAMSRAALARTPMRGISYGEVQAMAQRRELLNQRLAAAIDGAALANAQVRIGISPHAPYTVEPHAYRACVETGLPLATHLAESPHEATFLADHTGIFRDLWETLGWWDDRVPRFAGGPIRFAQSIGLLDAGALLAHVNYCDDDELAILAAGNASVVYCPRTHAYFQHPPHRWRDMLRAGINVAVGTDSTASAPDLNLVDDLRLLHQLAPEVSPLDLWRMATTGAARAIGGGLDRRLGRLAPGCAADFTAWDLTDKSDPLKAILETAALPTQTWMAGHKIFR